MYRNPFSKIPPPQPSRPRVGESRRYFCFGRLTPKQKYGERVNLSFFLFEKFTKQFLKLSMRCPSRQTGWWAAIWDFTPNWNDFAELEGEIWCSTVDMVSPDFPEDRLETCPYRNTVVCPFRHFWQLNFLTLLRINSVKYLRLYISTDVESISSFKRTQRVFGINPLLGAMGLVLTRLSRSSNTLKEVHWRWSC